MTVLRQGLRSSVVLHEEGDRIVRVYHDTATETPLPISVDERGTLRVFGNRRIASLLARGDDGGDGGTPSPPPHIHRTHALLADGIPRSVSHLARILNVRESTAWSYLYSVVEHYTSSKRFVRPLLFQPLLEALPQIDQTGTLRQVMQRLDTGPFDGVLQWQYLPDRYSHLRLARVCLRRTSARGRTS